MRLKNRHYLRSNEIKKLKNEITENFEEIFVDKIFSSNNKVEIAEIEGLFFVYIIDGELLLFRKDNSLIPSLKALKNGKFNLLKVIVDMGAIKYVINGADIMRPGIVMIDDGIKKDSYIKIVDEKYNKPIAIGRSLFNSNSMKNMVKGKAVKNIHYINDKIWNLLEIISYA